MQAKEAVLNPVDDDPNRYTLTMKLTDDNVGNIIEFSDRPHRIVKMMTAKQLYNLWGERTNSFKDDPPNAVLSANGFDVRIVILESMTIDNGVLTYILIKTDQSQGATLQPDNLEQAILTIDRVKRSIGY